MNMKYTLTRDYHSYRAGPWREGEVVNLDDQELIAWIGRDAPGVLEPYTEKRQVEESKDRMVKGKQKRTKEPPPPEKPVTFGATKSGKKY